MIDSFKQKHFAYISQDFYRQLKHCGDYAGVFFFKKPVLVVLSPEFAKTILVKDFQYFVNRGIYYNKEDDPLSANLFFIEGDEWRNLRNKMSPTFSSDLNEPIEIREYLARYTTDVIGSCGFGIECNSIVDPKSEFRTMGKKMFNFSKIKNLKLFLSMLMRTQARALRIRFNDEETIKFVMQIVAATIKHRKENNVKRNDFMQLMINLYKDETTEVKSEDSLTLEEISAQSFVFFFAGFETSSTTMTYALHELAINPEMQEKLRTEINDGFDKNNGLTYDSIIGMTYLDKVINETLRKYPPVASLHRVLNKDYRLPNGSVVPEGTLVMLPTYAFHHDPENFPNPSVFDPDRFSEDVKSTRHPFAFLPFGEGMHNAHTPEI